MFFFVFAEPHKPKTVFFQNRFKIVVLVSYLQERGTRDTKRSRVAPRHSVRRVCTPHTDVTVSVTLNFWWGSSITPHLCVISMTRNCAHRNYICPKEKVDLPLVSLQSVNSWTLLKTLQPPLSSYLDPTHLYNDSLLLPFVCPVVMAEHGLPIDMDVDPPGRLVAVRHPDILAALVAAMAQLAVVAEDELQFDAELHRIAPAFLAIVSCTESLSARHFRAFSTQQHL